MASEKEGTLPFPIPGIDKPCSTWYKTIGDLHSGTTPVVVVHGGPGLTHDYLLQLSELNSLYGIPVVFYDQIGNGKSTHLREKSGDESFWVEELFWRELENLVVGLGIGDSWDLLGHSWGGMMGATFAGRTPSPKGLRKLILGNAPAYMSAWVDAYGRYLEAMDDDVKAAIKKGEETGERESKEYEAAMEKFMAKHCLGEKAPPELAVSFEWAGKDETVSKTMSGSSEFVVTGNMKNWSAVEASKLISVPTLVINGVNEGATDEAIKPFLDNIKGVKYVKFHHSSHMGLYEEKELYLKTVGEWLLEK
ncbi:proline iminopeptidase [Mollisia scopiformis]|uniref:Proline iminopeptidase n=1 Tax=Mollisia scopiformis TaxID=149040 RepID=A0A194XX71_MOLSC|nr:proline iminopeptidase [Mollisia scopiformis]KUJ24387.1 proline iminopeptidase [Mollisia scopiformis]